MTDGDVVVVGGGVVGSAVALFSAEHFDRVTVYDANDPAAASGAATGILPAPDFLRENEPPDENNAYAVLSRRAYDFYPGFVDRLEAVTDRDLDYRQVGCWVLADTPEARRELEEYHREMQKYGRSSQWAEPGTIANELPMVSRTITGGYFHAEECLVRPGPLLEALRSAARGRGVEYRRGTRVRRLRCGPDDPPAVTVEEGETREARHVVVAAGCWSRAFEESLGVGVPVEPRRGQTVHTRWETMAGMPILRQGDYSVTARSDGRVLVGATVEESGFEGGATLEGVGDLLAWGTEFIEGLSERPLLEVRSGLRPHLRRTGGPLLGPVPEVRGVYLATGHYRSGILQGPYSGYLLAQSMAGEEPDLDLTFFAPPRPTD